MTRLLQQIADIYGEVVLLHDDLDTVLSCCVPEGQGCRWREAPDPDGRGGEAVMARCLLQVRRLCRDIDRARADLRRRLELANAPAADAAAAAQARQIFFLDTFLGFLDWSVQPLERDLRRMRASCTPGGMEQIRQSSSDLQWHITELNGLLCQPPSALC